MIAALFVEAGGVYFGLNAVDPWDEARDARTYPGPHPVVAHPPCDRWGRFWNGGPSAREPRRLGADAGCFFSALWSVRTFGGVLEHPKDSHAWTWFGLRVPPRRGGWIDADEFNGRTCCVWQGHYGHFAGKPTWLYAVGHDLPELIWGPCAQRIHPRALELHGYAKARRIGMLGMVGGKNKKNIRSATPPAFRDVLIRIAVA